MTFLTFSNGLLVLHRGVADADGAIKTRYGSSNEIRLLLSSAMIVIRLFSISIIEMQSLIKESPHNLSPLSASFPQYILDGFALVVFLAVILSLYLAMIIHASLANVLTLNMD